MPAAPIFFGNDQRSGNSELAGASPRAINVVTDGAGAVRRRPGISEWDGYPETIPNTNEVIGLHDFEDELYVVYGDRRIFKVASGAATDLSTAGGPSYLAGTGRPVFAETAFRLLIAGGAAPEKVDSTETVAERLGGSPPDSTHVVALAQRIITNDLTDSSTADRVRFSRTGNAGNEVWDALNFVTAEAKPDGIVALGEKANRLFAFGARTLQIFAPDGNTILAPLATYSRGLAAAHSVIAGDEDFAWLSDRRQFLQGDGGSLQVLSDPISRTLSDISTVSDAIGFRWDDDQFDVLAWLFPTDGRTFALQQGGGWAQWHGWTQGQGHTPLPITAHHFWPEENVHLVGLETGQVAKFDSTATSDLGEPIKAEVLTGFINRDTDAWKHCKSVRFTFRRGHTTSSTEPVVLLSWRDNLGAFCNPIRLGLGEAGDYVFTVEKRSLGTYRARQWKLEFTEALDFVLARAEEVFTVGGQT